MPFGVGCDKKTVVVPIEGVFSDWSWQTDQIGSVFYWYWPYLFGAYLAVLLLALAVVRPRTLAVWLMPIPIAQLLFLTSLGFLVLFTSSEDLHGRLMFAGFTLLPPLIVCLWVAPSLKRKEFLLAAARLNGGLAILIPWWLYLLAGFSFLSHFLYGFYMAVCSGIALTLTTWLIYARGERAFCDRNAAHRNIQFRIRTMLAWTLIVACASAFFQYVE